VHACLVVDRLRGREDGPAKVGQIDLRWISRAANGHTILTGLTPTMVETELDAMAPHADPGSWVAPCTERFIETASFTASKSGTNNMAKKNIKNIGLKT
jgi:hypothetical protein